MELHFLPLKEATGKGTPSLPQPEGRKQCGPWRASEEPSAPTDSPIYSQLRFYPEMVLSNCQFKGLERSVCWLSLFTAAWEISAVALHAPRFTCLFFSGGGQ